MGAWSEGLLSVRFCLGFSRGGELSWLCRRLLSHTSAKSWYTSSSCYLRCDRYSRQLYQEQIGSIEKTSRLLTNLQGELKCRSLAFTHGQQHEDKVRQKESPLAQSEKATSTDIAYIRSFKNISAIQLLNVLESEGNRFPNIKIISALVKRLNDEEIQVAVKESKSLQQLLGLFFHHLAHYDDVVQSLKPHLLCHIMNTLVRCDLFPDKLLELICRLRTKALVWDVPVADVAVLFHCVSFMHRRAVRSGSCYDGLAQSTHLLLKELLCRFEQDYKKLTPTQIVTCVNGLQSAWILPLCQLENVFCYLEGRLYRLSVRHSVEALSAMHTIGYKLNDVLWRDYVASLMNTAMVMSKVEFVISLVDLLWWFARLAPEKFDTILFCEIDAILFASPLILQPATIVRLARTLGVMVPRSRALANDCLYKLTVRVCQVAKEQTMSANYLAELLVRLLKRRVPRKFCEANVFISLLKSILARTADLNQHGCFRFFIAAAKLGVYEDVRLRRWLYLAMERSYLKLVPWTSPEPFLAQFSRLFLAANFAPKFWLVSLSRAASQMMDSTLNCPDNTAVRSTSMSVWCLWQLQFLDVDFYRNVSKWIEHRVKNGWLFGGTAIECEEAWQKTSSFSLSLFPLIACAGVGLYPRSAWQHLIALRPRENSVKSFEERILLSCTAHLSRFATGSEGDVFRGFCWTAVRDVSCGRPRPSVIRCVSWLRDELGGFVSIVEERNWLGGLSVEAYVFMQTVDGSLLDQSECNVFADNQESETWAGFSFDSQQLGVRTFQRQHKLFTRVFHHDNALYLAKQQFAFTTAKCLIPTRKTECASPKSEPVPADCSDVTQQLSFLIIAVLVRSSKFFVKHGKQPLGSLVTEQQALLSVGLHSVVINADLLLSAQEPRKYFDTSLEKCFKKLKTQKQHES